MMMTLNCGWLTPGEEEALATHEKPPAKQGVTAIFGVSWRPDIPDNDNLPEWLDVLS